MYDPGFPANWVTSDPFHIIDEGDVALCSLGFEIYVIFDFENANYVVFKSVLAKV